MSEYIEVGQPLQFTDPNTPTRVGEMVENVSDIYNIPSPRLGMQVFVKSEKKSFVITSLKSKVIGGVDVPEAAVEAFEPVGMKEVGSVESLDDIIDNGIYSGVWTKGFYNAYPMTFVLVVINDYAMGEPRRVSQFLYGLSKFDGSVAYQSRVWDDSKDKWGDWEILNREEIVAMISAEVVKIVDGAPGTFDTLKEIAAWIEQHGGDAAEMVAAIERNTKSIAEETERAVLAEDELRTAAVKEKEALKNGDTIVGLAREIYSRTGKTEKATFLQRTTAGGTSISDGVASVKQIGGNIVKNLFDINVVSGRQAVLTKKDSLVIVKSNIESGYYGIYYGFGQFVTGHSYYTSCVINSPQEGPARIFIGVDSQKYTIDKGYNYISAIKQWRDAAYVIIEATAKSASDMSVMYKPILIDLTEMYGAGSEPTKEECDKMFGTMPALPQGITIAQPTGLKSTGYNQWNPQNIIEDTYINDNALEDNSARDIAVVECVPCAVGAGENNGYVIGYGEGDTWSDEGIEVYFSPLNPMGTEDELYLDKLEKDSTYGTYVPMANGYLLVVTPTTDKLCAHLHWSGDRARNDYEEYIESNVAIPAIPQMSEYGLAGISSSGTMAQDTIDLERMIYTKRIGTLDLGTLYFRASSKPGVYYAALGNDGNTEYSLTKNVISPDYGYSTAAVVYNATSNKTIYVGTSGYFVSNRQVIAVCDTTIANGTGIGNIRGILYYELESPEEYPIVTKTDPNYIGSDYGVEKWMGSRVPLSANILFYMRSLVGETRNFLDQLYKNTEKSDAKEVANHITKGIKENKALAVAAPNLALRALFIAAGAEYNDTDAVIQKTAPWGTEEKWKQEADGTYTYWEEPAIVEHLPGHYYLNGLGDITEEEMLYIYNAGALKANIGGFYSKANIRTFLSSRISGQEGYSQFNLTGILSSATAVETAIFGVDSLLIKTHGIAMIGTTMYAAFSNCSRLKYIQKIAVSGITNISAFNNCNELVYVELNKLKVSVSFAQSKKISKKSILAIIANATPTSAITITVHPDAYVRIVNQSDIVEALAAQPLVTLVSA